MIESTFIALLFNTSTSLYFQISYQKFQLLHRVPNVQIHKVCINFNFLQKFHQGIPTRDSAKKKLLTKSELLTK